MSWLRKIPLVNRLLEQKALVGDAVNSIFRDKTVKQPRNLANYKKRYDTDSTVGISIDALSEMVAGCGHYPTVEDEEKNAWALEEVNALADRIRLDEQLINISKCMDIYGFCPVERVTHRGPPGGILQLLILDPPTVTYKRDSFKVMGYTQTIGFKKVEFRPDEFVWFVNNQVRNAKGAMYGVSRIARVMTLLEIRDQVIENINGIMKNQSRPPVIWKVPGPNDVLE